MKYYIKNPIVRFFKRVGLFIKSALESPDYLKRYFEATKVGIYFNRRVVPSFYRSLAFLKIIRKHADFGHTIKTVESKVQSTEHYKRISVEFRYSVFQHTDKREHWYETLKKHKRLYTVQDSSETYCVLKLGGLLRRFVLIDEDGCNIELHLNEPEDSTMVVNLCIDLDLDEGVTRRELRFPEVPPRFVDVRLPSISAHMLNNFIKPDYIARAKKEIVDYYKSNVGNYNAQVLNSSRLLKD